MLLLLLLIIIIIHRRQFWGLGCRDPRFWARRSRGGSQGGRGRVSENYYSLLCTKSMLDSGFV